MTINHDFRNLEKRIGAFYAPSFYEFLDHFLKISSNEKFHLLFKKYHFCSEAEIRYAIAELIPDEFIPFLVVEQSGFEDYYCFDKENSENKNRVVVFSQDSIVCEWKNYTDFLVWVSNNLRSLT